MIGNPFLRAFCESSDRDTGINQLLELLHNQDSVFIESLTEPVELDRCTEEELCYLTIVSALIDYYLQRHGLPVPPWIRDSRLSFAKPFFYSRRLSDLEKVRLLYSCPAPFKARNVYFDPAGICRV